MAWGSSLEVRDTPDLRRILNLPKRRNVPLRELAELLTQAFRRPGGTQTLWEIQALALSELADYGGLMAPVGVGQGKTLVSFLAPKVVEAKRPVLLVPAKLRDKTLREYDRLQKEWFLPPLYLQSYETLGREGSANFFQEYRPDLLVCDEAHKLKSLSAAVTRRVKRHIQSSEQRPWVVLLSGTFTRKSLMDYWHLTRWALGPDRAPVPMDWMEAQIWAGALDGGEEQVPPGALRLFMDNPKEIPTLEKIRSGFRSRFVSTPGIVATNETGYPGSLVIRGVSVPLPKALQTHLYNLRERWETPDGHPFADAPELWRHARELACGFFYRWNPRPPENWLLARKVWCAFVRKHLSGSRKLDTELQVRNAVIQGELPHGVAYWKAWEAVKDTFQPNTEPVWLDNTILEYARKWLHQNHGLCWVEHIAFGEALAKLSGLPYYGKGGLSKTGGNIELEKGPCIVSIAANSEGRNLQRYSKNLIVSVPPNAATLEQLIGRTHRNGQTADEVEVDILLVVEEQRDGFQNAIRDARYIQETTGNIQKLCIADIDT